MNNPCTSDWFSYVKTGKHKPLRKISERFVNSSPGIATLRVVDKWRSLVWKSSLEVTCSCGLHKVELSSKARWAPWAGYCLAVLQSPQDRGSMTCLNALLPTRRHCWLLCRCIGKKRVFFTEKFWISMSLDAWNSFILFIVPALWVNKMSKKPWCVYENIRTDVYHQQALTEKGVVGNISNLIYY